MGHHFYEPTFNALSPGGGAMPGVWWRLWLLVCFMQTTWKKSSEKSTKLQIHAIIHCPYPNSDSKFRIFRQFWYRELFPNLTFTFWRLVKGMVKKRNKKPHKVAIFPLTSEFSLSCWAHMLKIWLYMTLAVPYGPLGSAWSAYLKKIFLAKNGEKGVKNIHFWAFLSN